MGEEGDLWFGGDELLQHLGGGRVVWVGGAEGGVFWRGGRGEVVVAAAVAVAAAAASAACDCSRNRCLLLLLASCNLCGAAKAFEKLL